MLTADVTPGPNGFEQRTFECLKCGHAEKKILASDPLNSDAFGWIKGDLLPPT
jgi:hypothetical protein